MRVAQLTALVAATLATCAAYGQQAAPKSPHTLTGNVGLYSQYIFRGLTQTDRDPALQGGFDYSHASGFYAGTWASNISWLRDPAAPNNAYSRGGSLEWDFYLGFKGNFGKSDFSYDAGLLYYWYPGDANTAANPLNIKANTLEVYGALGWKWLTAKYSHSVKNETFGVRDSRGTGYFDLSANVPIGNTGLTANLHWGYQKFRGNDPRFAPMSNDDVFSYKDLKLGLSYALPKDFTIGAFYTKAYNASTVGYGSVNEPGGIYPRNLARSTGTVFLQKTF